MVAFNSPGAPSDITVASPGTASTVTVISPGNLEQNPEQNLEGFDFGDFTPRHGINERQEAQNANKYEAVFTKVSPDLLKKNQIYYEKFTERLLKNSI